MFQATIKYWFPPEGQEIRAMESIQGLDYVQASASAVEGLISTQGWRGLVGSAVISCAVDGFSSEGAFQEFSLGECLQGAGSALLVGGVLQGVPALRDRFGGLAKTRLASGISRLIERLGTSSGKGWDMYRYLRPGTLTGGDVAALFDISGELTDDIATRIQQSPALQNLFRDDDWWVVVRKMTSSAENRAQLLDDLTGNVNLAQAFKERPELVGAWEVLYSKPAWRIKMSYLAKISRYKDSGLEVIDEGGELVVKQVDGVRVGKLDPNDPYYPGEMRVKGEVSKRHFDPDLAGGLIIKKSWENITISQQGIIDITTHLNRFGYNPDNANMIQRLNLIKNGEIQMTDFDRRFYTHELEEYARYRSLGIQDGVDPPGVWDNAHAASLEVYSINELITPLYHP